jgi:uncharacterized membrane protein
MKAKTTALAAAAALLFTAGAVSADEHEKAAAGDKIKCEGVNSCHGQSACKTAKNECAGKNGCAGQGFKMMTKAECDAAKAKAESEK